MAAGASGKSGGLLALWAYPECLVPLSYRLHKELAEQYGGDQKWGYRRVKCGTIGAVVKRSGTESKKAAKEHAQTKTPAAQPGMSALQANEKEPSPDTIETQTNEAKPTSPLPATRPLPTIQAKDVVPAPEDAPPNPLEPHNLTNGNPSQFTKSAFAPIPGLTPTPEPGVISNSIAAPGSVDGRVNESNNVLKNEPKLDSDVKEWEKLPKQDTAATSLLGNSTLPADLDWIESQYVQYYEEMGRRGFTETAQVHPFHFTNSIAELARSAGVDIRTGAKVTNLTTSQRSADFKVVEYLSRHDNDEIKSIDGVTDVIVTAGPWTGKLLPRSKIEGLRAHSVVYEADVSPYAVFTDIQLPGDYVPEHRAMAGQKRKHRGNVDPEVYARPFGEVYACGESFYPVINFKPHRRDMTDILSKVNLTRTFPYPKLPTRYRPTRTNAMTLPPTWAPSRQSSPRHQSKPNKPVISLNTFASVKSAGL